MPALKDLFKGFLRERREYKNITPKTEKSYADAFSSFSKLLPEVVDSDQLNKEALLTYFERLSETGVSPVSRNTYGRSLNAFFKWLHDEGFIGRQLKLPKVATEKLLVRTLPEENIETLIEFNPKTYVQKRTHILLLLLLETGLRISEALSLKVSDVDMVHCRLKVVGKGRKERMVKFNPELRRRLDMFINLPEHRKAQKRWGEDCYLFCTRDGGPLRYDNVRRDYKDLCEAMGVKKVGGFHRFRHHFGSNYVKRGGNVFELSDQLGHADLKTTRIYVTVDEAQLEKTNAKTSILGNWRKRK
jgi:integrase/recombinase XerD